MIRVFKSKTCSLEVYTSAQLTCDWPDFLIRKHRTTGLIPGLVRCASPVRPFLTRSCVRCATKHRAGTAVRNDSDKDVICYQNTTRLPVIGTES